MSSVERLNLETWESVLGLIPIPLRAAGEAADGNAFVLQNGQSGNLCLDFEGREPSDQTRSEIWSSNVGHFVSLQRGQALVQRWDSPTIERYSESSIRTDLEGFHRYLEKSDPHVDMSVVAHVISVFRRLRKMLGPDVDGPAALDVLLFTLASTESGHQLDEGELSEWHLPTQARATALAMDPRNWDAIAEALLNTGARDTPDPLKVDCDLVLRHASGLLFQEAHFAAVFESPFQIDIPGLQGPVAVGRTPAATGVYFTPPALARAIAEEAVGALHPDRDEVVVFDPACGSGEFLKEAKRSLRRRGYEGRIRLIGNDISAAAAQMARFSLAWEASDDDQVVVDVRTGNSLEDDDLWPDSVDLVLMNPPFVSWGDMSPQDRKKVRDLLGSAAKYRPDMAIAFVLRAAERLGPTGVIGSIAPASFFDGDSSAPVRQQLGEALHAVIHARLGSQSIFPSAIVDAGFFVLRRASHDPGPVAFWADHRVSSVSRGLRLLRVHRATSDPTFQLKMERGISIYRQPDLGATPSDWMPRRYQSWKTLEASKHLPSISRHFAVHQGVRTGANPVFLLTAAELGALPESERAFFRPAVVNASIVDGQLLSSTYVFYPLGDKTIDTEESLERLLPTFYSEVLAPSKGDLLKRSRVDEKHWWMLSEPRRSWQMENRPKIVTTYFGERGSFTADVKGDIVVVQGHGWLPKRRKKLNRTLMMALVALFNSRFFVDLLGAKSGQVAGGQWNLSKKFLDSLPLPDVWDLPTDLLQPLATLGERILRSGLSQLTRDEDEAIEELASAAYGLERL